MGLPRLAVTQPGHCFPRELRTPRQIASRLLRLPDRERLRSKAHIGGHRAFSGVMARTITAFFRTPGEAQTTEKQLFENGFTREEISFVTGDTREHETPSVGPVQDSGAEVEAGRDTWIGGATVGAAAGGLIGLLKEYGVPAEEAEFYAEGVRRGGALLTVHGVSEDREDAAKKICQENGAVASEELAREWGRSAPGSTPRVRKAG